MTPPRLLAAPSPLPRQPIHNPSLTNEEQVGDRIRVWVAAAGLFLTVGPAGARATPLSLAPARHRQESAATVLVATVSVLLTLGLPS